MNGSEKLSAPMRPITQRNETLAEYERGVYFEERALSPCDFKEINGGITVSLAGDDGELLDISYVMTDDGALHVSERAYFPQSVSRPTFIGFETAGIYESAKWKGTNKSSYPDRNTAGEYGAFEETIAELDENYTIDGESGNRLANSLTLSGENGSLTISSPIAFNWRAKETEDGAGLRIGGYIAGLSESEKYKLNNSYYGFSFEMSADGGAKALSSIYGINIDGEKFTDFAPGVKRYVYRTGSAPKIEVVGDAEITMTDEKCTLNASDGEYTIYFAPEDIYLSDIAEKSMDGVVEKDSASGGAITLGGDRFRGESDKVYEKGLNMKAGSGVTYDVSGFDNNVFSAILGKNSSMNMFGGFSREMFDAEATVKIYLDGELALEEGGISMRSGKGEISLDISGANELRIEVSGSGEEGRAQYEDAVLADARIVPKGAVLFTQNSGDATEVTVLNPDRNETDCLITAENDGKITVSGVRLKKGEYRTIELYGLADDAKIEVVVSGLERQKLNRY